MPRVPSSIFAKNQTARVVVVGWKDHWQSSALDIRHRHRQNKTPSLIPVSLSRDRGAATRPSPPSPSPLRQRPRMSSQSPVLAQLQAANDEWRHAVLKVSPDFFQNSAKGQTPKVLWFGCADSRVPESVLLAAKPGDLFVHRNIAKYASPQLSQLPNSQLPNSPTPQSPQFPNSPTLQLTNTFSANSTPMTILLSPFLPTPSSTSASNMVRSLFPSPKKTTHTSPLVIVAGHTQCGGCVGAWNNCVKPPAIVPDVPLVRWLTPLIKLADSLGLASKPQAEAVDILVSPMSCRDPSQLPLPVYQVRESVKRQVDNVVQTNIIQGAWANRKDVRVHGFVYELETGKLKDLGVTHKATWA
jgi:carbonic anhydrase